jgi:hypothetical protein
MVKVDINPVLIENEWSFDLDLDKGAVSIAR